MPRDASPIGARSASSHVWITIVGGFFDIENSSGEQTHGSTIRLFLGSLSCYRVRMDTKKVAVPIVLTALITADLIHLHHYQDGDVHTETEVFPPQERYEFQSIATSGSPMAYVDLSKDII